LFGRFFVCLKLLIACAGANAGILDGRYDLNGLGVPQFVNVNYIDLTGIRQISKFRSGAGHDYSDDFERCRSMKHYFITPSLSTVIRSPVAGVVSKVDPEFVGTQVQIVSDIQPGFIFILFHVGLAKPLSVGDRIEEGQVLGTHSSIVTFSDIAVGVNTTDNKYTLVSYFDTLTDAAFAPYQARGINSRSQMSFTKAEREANPYECDTSSPPNFTYRDVRPEVEYVDLSGTQRLTVTPPPETVVLGEQPYTLIATSNSGLPVSIATSSPNVCSVAGNQLSFLASGSCNLLFDQPGNATYLPADQFRYVITVLATPPGVRIGTVFSSAQIASQSFLRFSNSGTTPETVTIALADGATGRELGQWSAPNIPAGASAQVSIAAIEDGIAQAFTKPQFYSLTVQSRMPGSVQHVLWRPSDGTLTNLSTCDTGASIGRSQVSNVHSSLLQSGYPSTVVVTNLGVTEAPAQLGVFDAATGARLGGYSTQTIPSNGQISIAIPTLEAGAQISPGTTIYHYNIKVEGAFNGYLQHLVSNRQVGVTTDMTTACPMLPQTSTKVARRLGSVYSTAQTDLQSYLRIYNTGNSPGTVTLNLADAATGAAVGQWTSPAIGRNASVQFPIAAIESGAGITGQKPATYVISIQPRLGAGYLQHVLWRPSDGTLTNLSTCDDGVTAVSSRLINLHSKRLVEDYPSILAITNRSNATADATLFIMNAVNGLGYGRSRNAVPSMRTLQVSSADLEAAVPFILTTNTFHYNVTEETSRSSDRDYPFFMQHLMTNRQVGVITDMTTMCRLN
jgi:hypothetical protein